MSVQNYKVLIDVEVQMKAQDSIREMKKDVDQMDSKLSKMQSQGVTGGTTKTNRFLSKQGIFQTGATGDFDQIIQSSVNESIQDTIETEVRPGGKFDIRKLLGITGFNKETVESLKTLIINPKAIGMRVAQAMPFAAIAFLAVSVGVLVYKKLISRNNIFDLTWRRFVKDEMIKLRARELRQQIRVGERQAIFVSEAGETHPINVVNTFELVRNGQIFELDAFRIRKGYQF